MQTLQNMFAIPSNIKVIKMLLNDGNAIFVWGLQFFISAWFDNLYNILKHCLLHTFFIVCCKMQSHLLMEMNECFLLKGSKDTRQKHEGWRKTSAKKKPQGVMYHTAFLKTKYCKVMYYDVARRLYKRNCVFIHIHLNICVRLYPLLLKD